MQDIAIQKIKISLTEAIIKWLEENDNTALDTYLGEATGELMADAAMTVLLAQSDLSRYLEHERILKP